MPSSTWFQILYVSESAASASEVEGIVSRACQRNVRDGITGALISTGRFFAQVLEGTPEAVEATLGRIAADPRHERLTVLMRQDATARRFPGWSMGLSIMPGADTLLEGLLRNPPREVATAQRVLDMLFKPSGP